MARYFAALVLMLLGCADSPDPHEPWYPHVPIAWTVTPDGHSRDAGPFASVSAGWTTDQEIDTAIDCAFSDFATRFPEFAGISVPVAINDDYTIWVPQVQAWVSSGYVAGSGRLTVALWTRAISIDDPGAAFIVRPPGVYWGVGYAEWRHTAKPLCPAIQHELLHLCIGDPAHTSPLWARL